MKYSELNEKKQHGTLDFPIEYYRLSPAHPQYVMQLHWHREFEILRVISGSFRLYLNNTEYVLKSGDIAFISCGMLHRGEGEECVYECIVFDINMLRSRGGDKAGSELLPIISGDFRVNCLLESRSSQLYLNICSLFIAMRECAPHRELAVLGLLFGMFSRLYTEGFIAKAAKKSRSGHKDEVMISLLDWIDGHFTEHITLRRLSAVSGMNEKYLCHLFREYTDRTPIDYINSLRIEKACHEIAVSRRNVTEAAFESGFNDLSYFSKTFKKYKGISPKKYCASFTS